MTSDGKVSVSISEASGIGTILFSHPKSNSLPGTLLKGLAKAIDDLGKDKAAKVIVLQSEGEKAFCGGASFDEFKAATDVAAAKEFFSGFMHVILAIRRAPKFVVASVQGKAAGGGVGLIAAADYALATEAASVRLSELAIGIGPFIIGPAVHRKIGLASFNAMAIDADWRTAVWAKERGLYQETFSTIAALKEGTAKLAEKLSKFSPDAMSKLKAVLWEGTEDWETQLPKRVQYTSELSLSPFVRSAIETIS